MPCPHLIRPLFPSLTLLLAGLAAHPALAEWSEEHSMMSQSSAILAVQAPSASRQFAAGVLDTGQSPQGVVLTSSDGQSWSTAYQAGDTLISCMHFADESTGYIGGMVMQGFNIQPFLRKTTSGGSSFSDCGIPQAWGNIVTAVTVAPGGDVWAVMGDGVLLRSTDDGGSFTEVSLPVDGPTWNRVTFVDADHGWIVGGTPEEDPGDDDTDWSSGDDGDDDPLEQGGGRAVSDGTILRTTDGGDSWKVASDGHPVGFHDAVFLTAQRGILVGHADGAGRIYTTEDGGATLEAASLPTDGEGRGIGELMGVDAPCGNQAWAVGVIDMGGDETPIAAILFSGDGGRSWSLDPYPQDEAESVWDLWQYRALMDVAFAGADRGVAGGDSLAVLGYHGDGSECLPPEEDPLGDDDDGAAACNCDKEEQGTARRQAGASVLLALLGVVALRVRAGRRRRITSG